MNLYIKCFYIFLSISFTTLISCEPKEGKHPKFDHGSPNAPEIVERDADTVFNKVPGEAHHGIETYEEIEVNEDVNNP